MTTDHRPKGARKGALLFCLGLGLSGLAASCAPGVPRVASDLEPLVPAELKADYVSFTQNCSKCHDLDRPLRAHIDDVRHWDLYVAKMMRTAGSAISARESPKILRFLYWYTERKNQLELERAKEVTKKAPPEKPAAPARAEPAASPEPPAASGGQVPATDPNAVQPAPAQVNEGEGAP